MISRYESQLVFPADSADYIDNVSDFVFRHIYTNYAYVDSVSSLMWSLRGRPERNLHAYYQALWTKSGPFTIRLLR